MSSSLSTKERRTVDSRAAIAGACLTNHLIYDLIGAAFRLVHARLKFCNPPLKTHTNAIDEYVITYRLLPHFYAPDSTISAAIWLSMVLSVTIETYICYILRSHFDVPLCGSGVYTPACNWRFFLHHYSNIS